MNHSCRDRESDFKPGQVEPTRLHRLPHEGLRQTPFDKVNGATRKRATMTSSNFTFDVRLSAELLSQLHEGHLTPAMLLTMCILYNWANWHTGRVKNVSAGGLHTWTRKAYSERTFSEALRKLELMGWITLTHEAGSTSPIP